MGLASSHIDTPQDNYEHDLIIRAKQGDRWAFGELVKRHRQGVINVVYRMCGDANIAEDAAQECFIRAWLNLNKYQPKGSIRNWLYKIAMNAAFNLLRKEKNLLDVDAINVVDTHRNPEQSLMTNELSKHVQQAVLSLPQASRSVLVLREYEGLSYRDIANTLDIPVGTVMSRLNYARQVLRQSLAVLLEVQ
jgi:RNA polymerase sigma-70 factor (ECF subfamily)